MLPIRQNLLTITCLKSTPKTVLIEVCQLAEGKVGACIASNQTLADALGMSKATVVRKVEELEGAGLLVSHIVKAEGNRRYLRPTAAVRACYVGGSEADQLLAASKLTIVKNEPPAEIDYSQNGADYSQNGEVTIVKTDVDYSQNASRVIGDHQYHQVDPHTPTCEAWAGEREALQKKITDLEAEVTRLQAENSRLVPPVAAPPQRPAAAGPEAAPYSDASKALATEMAALWNISRMPRHGGLWALLTRFTHAKEQAGQLEEVARQFAGYRLHRQKRDIGPHDLKEYLGSEGNGFEGIWCQFDWPAKAATTRVNGQATQPETTTRAAVLVGNSPTKKW